MNGSWNRPSEAPGKTVSRPDVVTPLHGELVLDCRAISAGYGAVPVIHDLSIQVRAGEVVALLGPNGAGKTTTLLALSGVLTPLSGTVVIAGNPVAGPLHRRARRGVGFVTEERSVFRTLSTRDNLRVGRCSVDHALALFPELESRLDVKAGLLSGGEQQMLSLARALARRPRVLLADELSLGLSPVATERLFQAVRTAANESGTGVLLVEQQVQRALRVSDRGYVLRRGRLVMDGTSDDLSHRSGDILDAYFAGR